MWQCCSNNLSTRCVCNKFVASLLTSCDNAVPTTCQQGVFNKLWQSCANNLSTRCVCNRFVASLLTSCDNAVPTTCQQGVFAIGL